MASKRPAGDGSSQQDFMELYGDFKHNKDVDFDKTAEANDLYDAALTGSVNREKKLPPKVVKSPATKEMPVKEEKKSPVNYSEGDALKKLPLYIGNFPWWTSDTDLTSLAKSLGVNDVVEIKFVENKANGQSRGFAEVAVSTEESMKILLEKIPKCQLYGDNIDCLFATRQNYAVFESIANKRIPQRVTSRDSPESEFEQNTGAAVSKESSSLPVPPVLPPAPFANKHPVLSNTFFSQPHPLLRVPPNLPPPPMPHLFPPPPLHVSSQPPPNLHINPAFFPPGHDSYNAYNQRGDSDKTTHCTPGREFEELINRNKTIASTAITKAVAGATAGDLRMAMETLLTAIAVIKQSRVYADERCQTLVTSLRDCLVSIQSNQSSRSRPRSRSHSRDEERDWDRERERERERERDREDNYSTGREGAGNSRRYSDRSSSGERDKERTRSRDWAQRHRDRYR